jgi:hypothetical protein
MKSPIAFVFFCAIALSSGLLTFLGCAGGPGPSVATSPSVASTTASQAVPITLDQHFQKLNFLPLQERMRRGLKGLSERELFAVAELLLSASSKANEDLGFELLSATPQREVPCISYYQAESALRKAKFEDALVALKDFAATKPIQCDDATGNLFNCCPATKYRNASGLKRLAEERLRHPPKAELSVRLRLAPEAKSLRAPLVVWANQAFLLDTGAEHTLWNTACARELGLSLDQKAHYGGADSVEETLVASFAVPRKKVLGLPTENLAGFAMDLGQSSPFGSGPKLCGILSPQQVIPKGVLSFDWKAETVALCQGDVCRKALALDVNCPMYMFSGRPYFDAAINGGEPRAFLIDTGANTTSANLNYFASAPKLEKTSALVAGASQKSTSVDVLPDATVEFCGLAFRQKPFGVRAASESYEWRENGKLGMNLLLDSLQTLDFGRGGAVIK